MKHAHILNEKEARRIHTAASRIMELVGPLMGGNGIVKRRRRRRQQVAAAPPAPAKRGRRKRDSAPALPEAE